MFFKSKDKIVEIRPSAKLGQVLHVCWMLHNQCNNKCSYCQPFNYNGTHRWLKPEHIDRFIGQVFNHYKKDTYHFSFTGGEPTIWHGFGDLCQKLFDRGVHVGLTTNGSRRPEFWQKLAPLVNWVSLSFHPEHAHEDHFIKVIEQLSGQTSLGIRLMMPKQTELWNKSLEFGERIRSHFDNKGAFRIEYVPLQENFGAAFSKPLKYHKWQNEFFNQDTSFYIGSKKRPPRNRNVLEFYANYKSGKVEEAIINELVAHKQVNFLDWVCNAGTDLLFIDFKGDIFRATCMQGGKVGHIFDSEIKFPQQAIRCRKTFCPCGTDILTHKYSDHYIKPRTETSEEIKTTKPITSLLFRSKPQLRAPFAINILSDNHTTEAQKRVTEKSLKSLSFDHSTVENMPGKLSCDWQLTLPVFAVLPAGCKIINIEDFIRDVEKAADELISSNAMCTGSIELPVIQGTDLPYMRRKICLVHRDRFISCRTAIFGAYEANLRSSIVAHTVDENRIIKISEATTPGQVRWGSMMIVKALRHSFDILFSPQWLSQSLDYSKVEQGTYLSTSIHKPGPSRQQLNSLN